MGTRTLFSFSTDFDCLKSGLIKQFLYGNMFHVVDSFRDFVSKFFLFVFGSILTYVFSFKADNVLDKNHQSDDDHIGVFGQKEDSFEVHDTEYVNKTEEETEDSVVVESALASSTSKYEFSSERHISGFIEEPKTLTFSVQELFLVSNDPGEAFDENKAEDSVENFIHEKDLKKQKQEESTEDESSVFTEYKFLKNYDYLLKDFSPALESKKEMIVHSDGFPTSYDNFGGMESSESESVSSISENKEENIERILDMRDQRSETDDEFIELELQPQYSTSMNEGNMFMEDSIAVVHKETEQEPKSEISSFLDEEILSRVDSDKAEDNHEEENLVHETHDSVNGMEEEDCISDSDDDEEFSVEHEELLEQLKMELKLARTGGLPTIDEESESPKMVDELKPLKIDHKLERKDRMVEIHKFYKRYLDKTRKLDILNSQTMHAIGLLQMKEPGQSNKTRKYSVPAIKSRQNLRLFKPRKHEVNPTLTLIEELHKEFELVYVGEVCLSWEILHWQYRKVVELQEYDNRESRQYNQVAVEFQVFQVLLQRFIENEPFQSLSRVQNYVHNRSANGNFLHVPVIKDDNLKDKTAGKRKENDAITSPMLTEIIEESMHVFWEFLHADKYAASDAISRSPELQDSVDSELLTDIWTDFQKKEKRFKEILRSGSCIVKKFQKRREDEVRLNHGLFFTQVELRLISRVLNMSKLTTEQLFWCHEKLANINFSNRKLLLEPSFLLFPC